jgi:TolB-like protein/Tfp pilus assembly protein PilF
MSLFMVTRLFKEFRRRGVFTVIVPYSVTAWLLVQVASILVPALALPYWVVSFTVVCTLIGFPIAFYISWFFDWTEHGLKRTPKRENTEESVPLSRRHWLGLGLVSVAAIAIGVLSFDHLKAQHSLPSDFVAKPKDATLAVMVFKDLSPTQDLAYLAEGLAEDLIVNLGQTNLLQVTALSSTRPFIGKNEPAQHIAKQLQVSTLLEGSIRMDGNQILITANLIDADSGKTQWTQKYSRKLESFTQLTSEISRAISNKLSDNISADTARASASKAGSADAYLMTLKGKQALRERTMESITSARKYFEQAQSFDPEYAPAYVGAAQAIRQLAFEPEYYGDMDPQIAEKLARANIEKALVRAPDVAEVYGVLGAIDKLAGNDDGALANYDKAIELNHSYADAHLWRYLLLKNMGRLADAEASLQTAQKLDPLSPVVLINVGNTEFRNGDFAAANITYQQLIEYYPESPLGYRSLASSYYLQGDLTNSAEYWHQALLLSPESELYRTHLGDLFLEAGLAKAASVLLYEDYYEVNIAIANQEFTKVLELAQFYSKAYPDDSLVKFESAMYEVMWGDIEVGRQMFREIDDSIEETGYFDAATCAPGIFMAYAFDQGERQAYWYNKCELYLQTRLSEPYITSEVYYLQARIAALDNNNKKAQQALINAINEGWRLNWVLYDPILTDVIKAPDVQERLEFMQTDLAKHKAALIIKAKQWGYTD